MNLLDLFESPQLCPECGGPAFTDLLLAEKKDACYNKVRSRYKVWPSAYASGALVQCRKRGAANWGNKNESQEPGLSSINDDDWYEINDQGKVYKQSGPSSYRPTFGTREIKLNNGHKVVRGMTLKAMRLKQGKDQGVAEGLNEMDKSQTPPGRDGGTDLTKKQIHLGPEHVIKAKDVAKHALKALDKTMKKSHADTPKKKGVEEAFGPLPRERQQIRLGRHTVDIERVGLDNDYISFAWHDSQGQDHYQEVPVGDLGSYDDLIDRIKDEIRYQERQYTDQGVAEGYNEKIGGRYEPDDFDAMVRRLKKLAGAGPMKTVWDPNKRVYRNMPTAVQPPKHNKGPQ